jgi:hypothetical protein
MLKIERLITLDKGLFVPFIKKFVLLTLSLLLTCSVCVCGGTGESRSRLQARFLLCEEPATYFGDEIEIYLGSEEVPDFFHANLDVDEGECHSIEGMRPYFFDSEVDIIFKEETDYGGNLLVKEADAQRAGLQWADVHVKEDGRYKIGFEVDSPNILQPGYVLYLNELCFDEPGAVFGGDIGLADDVEIFVNCHRAPDKYSFSSQKNVCHRINSCFIFSGDALIYFMEDSDLVKGATTLINGKDMVGDSEIGVKIDGREYTLDISILVYGGKAKDHCDTYCVSTLTTSR